MQKIANVNKKSSISFGFSLTGKAAEEVTPNNFNWILGDTEKNVIKTVLLQTPAVKNWVDLRGDDLDFPVFSGDKGIRTVTVYGTMDTTRDGVPQLNEPYTEHIEFNVRNVPNIPATP